MCAYMIGIRGRAAGSLSLLHQRQQPRTLNRLIRRTLVESTCAYQESSSKSSRLRARASTTVAEGLRPPLTVPLPL